MFPPKRSTSLPKPLSYSRPTHQLTNKFKGLELQGKTGYNTLSAMLVRIMKKVEDDIEHAHALPRLLPPATGRLAEATHAILNEYTGALLEHRNEAAEINDHAVSLTSKLERLKTRHRQLLEDQEQLATIIVPHMPPEKAGGMLEAGRALVKNLAAGGSKGNDGRTAEEKEQDRAQGERVSDRADFALEWSFRFAVGRIEGQIEHCELEITKLTGEVRRTLFEKVQELGVQVEELIESVEGDDMEIAQRLEQAREREKRKEKKKEKLSEGEAGKKVRFE